MASNPSYEQSKQLAEASRETEWTKPSFGKELFLGHFRLDLIHPQPEPDPAAVDKGEAFLDRLRAFLTERVDRRQIEREARIPGEVIEGLEDLGALGMKIPEEYGGLGLSQVYYNKALAMAGTWHSSISTLLSAHQSIGLPEPLRLFGSEEQKRTWLPKLATDHISAFLLTEPDVGSDPARMSTTAVPTEDGTGYRINGTKLWATNGAIADVVVVMAVVPKSDGHKGGITAFICPCDREGITVEHRNEFMGLNGIENAVTRFDDVFVPNSDVIGGEGKGLRIALTTLNTGRLSLPAFCLSAVKYSLKIAREWAAERQQWGQPIGRHDPIAQKLAWLASRRCSTCRAAWPTTSATTSASRPRSRSSTDRNSAGPPSTRWSRSAAAADTRPPSRSPDAARSRCRPSRCCATCASTASSRARRRSCTC